MKYTPALLKDEHVQQIQEMEQHLSIVSGKELVLIAYSSQPEHSNEIVDAEQKEENIPRL
ncbi:hypothetical protein ACN9MH_18415 [Paenibacillus silvae]|uniref:hypothetical protein n=1 Tax=Paenibacillus TaxID=44249 RepID=UPI001C129689|nr:hypothetical protein [Paenibacillus barcinonensis]MBU5352414.1 hypothetical protein [Paenibacillus barcinonensis]